MDTLPLNSIAVPTLLMAIGLFFFIRASVKDRTESIALASDRPPEQLSVQLKQYFTERAYRPVGFDAEKNQVTFEGRVGASVFLAVFLSLLAAIGFSCVALVLMSLIPAVSNLAFVLVLLSPLAGWFYWRNANRTERVAVTVRTVVPLSSQTHSDKTTSDRREESDVGGSLAIAIGHRDELIALRQALPDLKPTETAAEMS